jgi:hypothetical protein
MEVAHKYPLNGSNAASDRVLFLHSLNMKCGVEGPISEADVYWYECERGSVESSVSGLGRWVWLYAHSPRN